MLRRELLKPLSQRTAVECRIGEAVDMIYAHAVDNAFGVKPENQRVNALECLRVLHTKAHQLVNVEEAAPVDFVVCGPPPCQTIVLTFEQCVQTLAALRFRGIECC